jgi:hypothetical protein
MSIAGIERDAIKKYVKSFSRVDYGEPPGTWPEPLLAEHFRSVRSEDRSSPCTAVCARSVRGQTMRHSVTAQNEQKGESHENKKGNVQPCIWMAKCCS